MFWLLVAAELSAPTPSNRHWLEPADTPTEIMARGILQSVRVELTITPEGKMQNCRVEISSGNPQLDAHTCRVLRRRARFMPATDIGGHPVYGVYRTSVDWWVGDNYPPPSTEMPEIELTVSSLPRDLRSPATVRLKFAVDESGRASSCAAEGNKSAPVLVSLGCEQLLKGYTPPPAKTAKGIPVASVQTATVQFRTK